MGQSSNLRFDGAQLEDYLARISSVPIRLRPALNARLRGLSEVSDQARRSAMLSEIGEAIDVGAKLVAEREAQIPKISVPSELPIAARSEEIIQTLLDHRVTIISGETGSGKSTQLPKLCLAAGLGRYGFVGHTQPRRIAARSVAGRICEELGADLGGLVGYSVRFDQQVDDTSVVKVMTDGVLLAELRRDPNLLAYDTIIVDEAHERTLNIDFLLGYLTKLIARRDDLRVIVTSATIDTDKFASHFGDAPIIEVSGRSFPVDIRYRALGQHDVVTGVLGAVAELLNDSPGDILVFSSNEREIREICAAIGNRHRELEVLALFARMPTHEQDRIFSPTGRRRVVVATNVAETSLTVPGITSVIDIGEARISRFSRRTKIQRLPIEPISRASADQRSGRCGRLGPGVAVRLYDETDYDTRDAFTEPELRRTNLASVILTMATQNLGAPSRFPFVDPPEPRAIADGISLLYELGAVSAPEFATSSKWVTEVGATVARLPLDPRLARMVVAGSEQGCLHEAIIVATGLTIRDPRERPGTNQHAADELHRELGDPYSDVLGWLRLFHKVSEMRQRLTRRKFKRWAQDRYLNATRLAEWLDLVEQVRASALRAGLSQSYSRDFDVSLPPSFDRVTRSNRGDDVHRAVLCGLVSQVGMRAGISDEYIGPRNTRFVINPGSACLETKPAWVMAATLIETSRLWARTVAPIDPSWLETCAPQLTKTEISEPEWDPNSGCAMVQETVRLFGLTVVADRWVPLAKYDTPRARDALIHNALVERDPRDEDSKIEPESTSLATSSISSTEESGQQEQREQSADVHEPDDPSGFLARNDSVRSQARSLYIRSGNGTFAEEYERVCRFYHQRIPGDVTSTGSLSRWYEQARAEIPDLLYMTVEDLLTQTEASVDDVNFPESLSHGGLELKLSYTTEELTDPRDSPLGFGTSEQTPSTGTAAVVIDVPVAALPALKLDSFFGIIPGYRRQAVKALVRALPKNQRKQLFPISETIDSVLDEVSTSRQVAEGGSFSDVLRSALQRRLSAAIPAHALDPGILPSQLRPIYRVLDSRGFQLAIGRDLSELSATLADQTTAAVAAATGQIEHPGSTNWDFGSIRKSVKISTSQGIILCYPSLVDQGDRVAVKLVGSRVEQSRSMWLGARRLLRLTVAAPLKTMNLEMTPERQLALNLSPHPDRKAWFDDLAFALLGQVVDRYGVAWDEESFARLQRKARRDLGELAGTWAPKAAMILDATANLRLALAGASKLPQDSVDDARRHLNRLTYPGHLGEIGVDRFDDLIRYLAALEHRMLKLPERGAADRAAMRQALELEEDFDGLTAGIDLDDELVSFAWSLEEMRVGLFAQHLGAAKNTSPARLRRRLARLGAK